MINFKNNKEFVDILKKLKSKCLSKSMILHSDIFKLGFINTNLSYNKNLELIHDLILEVFWDFNVVVPTFNYDFLSTKFYDVKRDKSQVGTLNEYFRKRYIINRTYTPVFNTVSTKKNSIQDKISCIDPHGKESFYENAYKKKFDVLCLGKFIPAMAHFVERKLNVPYRYKKKFTGKIKYPNGKISPILINYNVRPPSNCENIETDFKKIIKDLKKNKILYNIENKNSFVACFNARVVADFWIKKTSKNKFYFLTKKSKKKAKVLIKNFGNPLKFKSVENNF